tara:strand:- start:329 stop:565 length:237 start_codon:yes stop_codon:yes gene_type:complete
MPTELEDIDTLIAQRDDMRGALGELYKTGISSYTINGRTVTYEQRFELEQTINRLNRRIGARGTTNATGFNLVDLRKQ